MRGGTGVEVAGSQTRPSIRDSLAVVSFPPDSLSLSDIVIAQTMTRRVQNPAGRRDLAIRANQRLSLAHGGPLALYWEVYGLTLDPQGLAHCAVTTTIQHSGEEQGGLARIVRAIGFALGVLAERESPELTYERVARAIDGRSMEYMDLEVDFEEPGYYTVSVRVADLQSGMEKDVSPGAFCGGVGSDRFRGNPPRAGARGGPSLLGHSLAVLYGLHERCPLTSRLRKVIRPWGFRHNPVEYGASPTRFAGDGGPDSRMCGGRARGVVWGETRAGVRGKRCRTLDRRMPLPVTRPERQVRRLGRALRYR